MYEKWLDEPNEELSGGTPRGFFTQSRDARALLTAALETIKEGEEPDYLIAARLTELDDSRAILLRILEKGNAEQKKYAATVLSNRKFLPIGAFLELALNGNEDSAVREIAIDSLKEVADLISNELYDRAAKESDENRKILAEIASASKSGDDRFIELVTEIMYSGDVGYAAQLFVNYGDARAVYVMTPLLATVDYADYIELRSAIISLGGEPGAERDFEEDASREEIRRKSGLVKGNDK